MCRLFRPDPILERGFIMPFSRRDAFKLGGLGALGVAGLAIPLGNVVSAKDPSQLPKGRAPVPYGAAFGSNGNYFQRLKVLQKTGHADNPDGLGPVDYYDQSEKVGTISVIPGGNPTMLTPVLGYDGQVPGYRIDVNQGTRIELLMRNKLPATHPTFGTPMHTSTHLHGSASLPQYDGYASDITNPGHVKRYRYPNCQPARTLWYHDHGVHYTAQNVYSGLATQYHLHDDMERALLPTHNQSLPGGGPASEYDVGLIVSDMMFQANGAQQYDDRNHSGLWGDVILVNGQPWPVMKVKKRVYRFRVLDASISRSYRFTLSPQVPMCVVATDGGIVPKAQPITQWRHGTAERYEILINFKDVPVGTRVELRNLSNPDNRDYTNTGKVMAFDVVGDAFDTSTPSSTSFPDILNPGQETMLLKETDAKKVRNIRVQHNDTTNMWNLNDMTWEDIVASGYKKVIADPALGDTEIWEIENKSGGWFHPLHIHLIDFKVLSRNGKAPFAWELGAKDVIYVGESEKIRLLMKFGKVGDPHYGVQTGRYMIHCHNLVHEDHDMMSQFSVGLKQSDMDSNVDTNTPPIATDCNHPVKADPPYVDTSAP
jgi:FtsP/CotA-like multicopper oxidase with cupredoxin domain